MSQPSVAVQQQQNTQIQTQQATASAIAIPHLMSLKHAATLSIEKDKPIMLDYYNDSVNGRCRLVKTPEKDTILYKTKEDYTSPLKKVMQIDASRTEAGYDIICESENSLYLVRNTILSNR